MVTIDPQSIVPNSQSKTLMINADFHLLLTGIHCPLVYDNTTNTSNLDTSVTNISISLGMIKLLTVANNILEVNEY